MIDIKELRYGAHVEHSGERGRVISLCAKRVELVVYDDNREYERFERANTDNIAPIPLTAALLDEIGFDPIRKTLGKHDEEWRMGLDGYVIRVTRGEAETPGREWGVSVNNWDYDVLGAADVAYLHQLENIIYLCTGKEIIKDEK